MPSLALLCLKYCIEPLTPSPLYFVVKVGRSYDVWKMMPKEMYARVKADPGLQDRLEQSPLNRADAEKRANELNSESGN